MMIRIPAGTYDVGSSTQQRQELCKKYNMHPSMLVDELPAQRVELPEFFIDEFPVTNAQYAAFIAATGAGEPYDWPLHATAERAHHPVVGVGGSDAEAYAKWAGKRLPTPQEWEAAFSGFEPMADRVVPGGQWLPVTYSIESDPTQRSKFGLQGFGQVCEWTCVVNAKGQFPFRLLKGGSWMSQESWGLRRQTAFYAFAPWCRQWTGLRCVADKQMADMPEAPLPQTGMPDYHHNPSKAGDTVKLLYGGGRGMGVALPHIGEALGIAAPEGYLIDGAGPKDSQDLYNSGPESSETGTVTYRFRMDKIENQFQFRAGPDFFDMDYSFKNLSDKDATVQASACMNAGLMDVFYDLEGSRSFIWLGKGDWMPLRSLPRAEGCGRWISYVTLPQPQAKSIIVAVLGKNSPMVFAYGRPNLLGPMALANNFCFSCLHLDPQVTVPAGGEATTRARVYCIKSGLDDVRTRFVKDFGL
ncbi:MAG: formylglycine-generating enzyme family protein [Planctomycetaceae bacterium]|nr:formylglycine-generating enzyme family protein [Planctomycetaceae bacterium]